MPSLYLSRRQGPGGTSFKNNIGYISTITNEKFNENDYFC